MSKILQKVFDIMATKVEDVSDLGLNEMSNDMIEEGTTTTQQHVTYGSGVESRSNCHAGSYSNIVDELKARQCSNSRYFDHHGTTSGQAASDDLLSILRQRYKRRGILVSYDVHGSFQLKQLVTKTVQELKALGFEDDLWFDHDEGLPQSSASFAQRLEVAEECNAGLIFLTANYLSKGPCKYEADMLIRRANQGEINPNGIPFRFFVVKCEHMRGKSHKLLLSRPADVSLVTSSQYNSIASTVSEIIGTLSEKLEMYVTFSTKLYREVPIIRRRDYDGYKGKTVDRWDTDDVQDWLGSLGIHERYRLSFEENDVDGFLLESLSERDMSEVLYVDSKVTRHKILCNLKHLLDKEKGESWDRCCLSRKNRDNSVYVVADPADAWVAEFIKTDLQRIGICVNMHDILTNSSKTTSSQRSKHNLRYLAETSTVVVVLTQSIETSQFMFKELLFVAWLHKPIITAVFHNAWSAMRLALQAVLGREAAINFGRNKCLQGLEILRYHVMSARSQPRAIFQQQYVEMVLNGLKPLENMVCDDADFNVKYRPKVFLSYHWEMETKAARIKEFLDRNGCECLTDVTPQPVAFGLTKPWQQQSRAGSLGNSTNTCYLREQMSHCNVLVICISLKYLYSDNFVKDIQLAQLHSKPTIPVMVAWCSRPLDRVYAFSRRHRTVFDLMDLSTSKLVQKNLPELLRIIMRISPS